MRKRSNLSASVRQRLLNYSRQAAQPPNAVWVRYGIERLLYRLSLSERADDFILKGAMLFAVWTDHPLRPTRDLDLGVRGNWTADSIGALFRSLCVLEVEPDGLQFDPETVAVTDIRQEAFYHGWQVTLQVQLDTARLPLRVDIGVGDAVVPEPQRLEFPTLLDFPAPRLHAYPVETVIAEKLHALVTLDMRTSRMKDLLDLILIARQFQLEGDLLVKAVRATFNRRQTPLKAELPAVLTPQGAADAAKVTQWRAFLRKSDLTEEGATFDEVISLLQRFAAPVLLVAAGVTSGTDAIKLWPPGGPWQPLAPKGDT